MITMMVKMKDEVKRKEKRRWRGRRGGRAFIPGRKINRD